METINDLGKYTFPAMFANSVKKFGSCNACTVVGQTPITYSKLNEKVDYVARLLTLLGAKPATKVAILGNGSPSWVALYFAIVNYGRIAVPLLPDFSTVEIETICAHCEPEILVVSEAQYKRLSESLDKLPETIIQLEDYKVLKRKNEAGANNEVSDTKDAGKKSEITESDIKSVQLPDIEVAEDDTASICPAQSELGLF